MLDRVRRFIRYRFQNTFLPQNKGYCPICEAPTVFVKYGDWLRDHYKCTKCYSIPRNRAIVNALNKFYPDWKMLEMHESSPGGVLSNYLSKVNSRYSSSHFFDDVARGEYKDGFRSEDLTRLTFPDESIDLFITSDVFEHIMEPEKAFAEIGRVLKPGGAHIFSMPWYPQLKKSRRRAAIANGKIEHLLDPVYHGNPIDEEGSLVTMDWGQDFVEIIHASSRLFTTIYLEKNITLGLDAELLEVFISVKSEKVFEDKIEL